MLTNSPKLIRGGIVLLDPVNGNQKQVIVLQYNPDQLTRTLTPQMDADSAEHHADPFRLKAPAIETLKLDAEIDASDDLANPDDNPNTVELGVGPSLAILELLVYPSVDQLTNTDQLADSGKLEILPAVGPMVIFVWGKGRVMPVKITEFSITEEAFDANLNPIRAKVSLGMRVLTNTDLNPLYKKGRVYLAYQQEKERQAKLSKIGKIQDLGIGAISV